jgi:hypothetical protein
LKIERDKDGNEIKVPTKLFHDLKSFEARNLLRAGVLEKISMSSSGHKTRSVFDRCSIVSDRDKVEAIKKVHAYHLEQEKRLSEVESITDGRRVVENG